MKNLSRAGIALILGLVMSGLQTGTSQAGVITQNVAFEKVTLLSGGGFTPLWIGASGFPPLTNDPILSFDNDLGDLVSVEITMTGTMMVSARAVIQLFNYPFSSLGTLTLTSRHAEFWFNGLQAFSSNTLPKQTALCSGILSCVATLPAPDLLLSASNTFYGDQADRFSNTINMDIINSGVLRTSPPVSLITGRVVVAGTFEIKYNYTSIAPGSGEAGTTSEGGHKVPEPGTLGLLMAGFIGLGITRRRRRTRALREKVTGQA